MKKLIVNLKPFLGMADEFLPHYQFEKSLEFDARVSWYMEHYYNPEYPERYMDKMTAAVQYANKSIMLEKLDIAYDADLEEQFPDEFKKAFMDIAKAEPGLVVENDSVRFLPDLVKSANGEQTTANELFETLWKKTFDTILSNHRM